MMGMRGSVRAFLLGSMVLSTTALAQAADAVGIRSFPGYPPPGRSSESIAVRVERSAPAGAGSEQEIDRFFAAVATVLADHRIDGDWQLVIPDAPYIEITVDLHGRRIRLASAHVPLERSGNQVVTERGAEALGQRTRAAVLSEQREAFRRHRAAFDGLLELTLRHARARLAP